MYGYYLTDPGAVTLTWGRRGNIELLRARRPERLSVQLGPASGSCPLRLAPGDIVLTAAAVTECVSDLRPPVLLPDGP